jgi:hypothetical protein
MGDSKATATAGGIGFCGLFFLVLFVLKVTGYLTCSWFWILAPLWGPFALILAILVIVGGIYLIAEGIDKRKRTKHRRRLEKFQKQTFRCKKCDKVWTGKDIVNVFTWMTDNPHCPVCNDPCEHVRQAVT